MYCPTCGSRSEERARFCVNCGEELQDMAYRPYGELEEWEYGDQEDPLYEDWEGYPVHVPNYLVQSILVTIFCCLPLGIAAIIFAAQVNGKVAAGDLVGAQSASHTAKTLCCISFIGGLLVGGPLLLLLR